MDVCSAFDWYVMILRRPLCLYLSYYYYKYYWITFEKQPLCDPGEKQENTITSNVGGRYQCDTHTQDYMDTNLFFLLEMHVFIEMPPVLVNSS